MAEERDSGSSVASRLETDARLDVIPLHSTDLLTLLDGTGVVRYESPSIERLYGFDQAELVGEQVAEYFHPEDRERVVAAFEAVVAGDGDHVETVEYRHLQADGSYRWIESVASANPTPEGHYVVNSRDISERKERERELRRARDRVRAERDGKEAVRKLLLETSTDGEIAASACRLLVDAYGYEAAWVVRSRGGGLHGNGGDTPARNGDGDPAIPAGNGDADAQLVAECGADRGFRTASGADGGPEATEPVDGATRSALDGGEPVTVTARGASGDAATGDAALADRLEACDLHAVRSVPLVRDGITYGALTVLRSGPGTAFADDLVDELAAALAFKRRVSRQEDALVAETVTELEIRIADGHVLAALSTAGALPAGTELRAEELRRDDDELATYLVTAPGTDAGTLEAAAAALPGVSEASTVATADARSVVAIRVDAPAVGRVLSGYGGTLQSVTARDGRVDLTVQLPRRTDVGAVVDTVRSRWPGATMRARSERTVDDGAPLAFDALTKKQDDALRAATVAGFFERPQRASAADVAETLGVSQSTFLHHLRAAERKVFAEAFAREDGDAFGADASDE